MVCVRTLKDPYPPSDVLHNFLPLPPKIRGGGGGGGVVFEISTKRGYLKGGGLLEREGSKLFCQFPLRKACFHYYWDTFFFFSCLVHVTNRPLSSCGLLSTKNDIL